MILIDSNQAMFDERQGYDLIEFLKTQDRVEKTELEYGDLMFTGKNNGNSFGIGMEFKLNPSDTIASLRDGRIPRQLIGMHKAYDLSYLMFIGEDHKIHSSTGNIMELRSGRWVETKFSWHYLNSYLMRFEAAGGKIRKVSDMRHLASMILSLQRSWTKDFHEEVMPVKERMPFISWGQLENSLLKFYTGMGISVNKAIALSEYYPAPFTLLMAKEIDLSNIEVQGKTKNGVAVTRKFGKASAKRVMDFLGNDHGTGVDGKMQIIRVKSTSRKNGK